MERPFAAVIAARQRIEVSLHHLHEFAADQIFEINRILKQLETDGLLFELAALGDVIIEHGTDYAFNPIRSQLELAAFTPNGAE